MRRDGLTAVPYRPRCHNVGMAVRSGPRCLRCQSDNPPGARVCVACGNRIGAACAGWGAACAGCGAALPEGARFCPGCGRALEASGSALARAGPESYTPRHLAERILTSRSAIEGERKPVTVLICDVASSTSLAERVGPD